MTEFEYKQYRAEIERRFETDIKALDRVYSFAKAITVQEAQTPSVPRKNHYRVKTGGTALVRKAISDANNEFKSLDIQNVVRVQMDVDRSIIDSEIYRQMKLGMLVRIVKGEFRKVSQ